MTPVTTTSSMLGSGVASVAPPVQALGLVAAVVLLVPIVAWAGAKAWERPSLLVAAMIVVTAVPWRTGGEGPELLHLTLADVASVVLVVVVLARLLWRPSVVDEQRLRSWVLLPMLGLVAAATLATFLASDAMTSLSGLARQAQLLVVVPLAGYLSMRHRDDVRSLVGAVLLLGVGQSILAVIQYATGTGASYGGEDIRGVGTFGAFAIMALPAVVTAALMVAVSLALVYEGRQRAWALGAVALLLPGLAVSFSRGYWLAALVGVLAVFAVVDWRRAALLLLAGVLAGGVLVSVASARPGSSPLLERVAGSAEIVSEPDQSVGDRYALWTAAVGMWQDHPVAGVGLKNYPRYRDSYVSFAFSGRSDIADPQGGFRQVELLTPHNEYLLVLAEQGLVGVIANAVFLASLGWAAVRRVRREVLDGSEPLVQVFGLTACGLFAVYLVSGIYGDAGGAIGLVDGALLFGGLLWFASGATLTPSPATAPVPGADHLDAEVRP